MSFFLFIFLLFKYYFSEKNIVLTNKSRTSYSLNLINKKNELPLLKDNTNNIIEYKNGVEKFKNKKKKRVWEELISDLNE